MKQENGERSGKKKRREDSLRQENSKSQGNSKRQESSKKQENGSRRGFRIGGISLLVFKTVFAVLVVTFVFMAAFSVLFMSINRINIVMHNRPLPAIMVLFLMSVVVGSIVAYIFSQFSLQRLQGVVDAINRLSRGEYSVRVDVGGPPMVMELGESFNTLAEDLEDLEFLHTDFANNFSHEFKTPIVSIKGFAQMLKEGDLTEEERAEYLDIVINESSRLASLATNVLHLSKVEQQENLKDKAEFNISEQVRDSVILLERKWEARGQEISINDGEDLTFVGSEELLGEVWVNLLDNAVKYAPEDSKIEIGLFETPQGIRYTIHNEGPAIPENVQRHIFEKFYQGDLSHESEGNGLGLALVKRIVELHEGDVFCLSGEDGTIFEVDLPKFF